MVIISHRHPETTGQPAYQPEVESNREADGAGVLAYLCFSLQKPSWPLTYQLH